MALTPAEKQRRYRERRKAGILPVHIRKPCDRRSRAQRWCDAVAELGALQEHYRDCLDRLPDSPPRHGYGRPPVMQAFFGRFWCMRSGAVVYPAS